MDVMDITEASNGARGEETLVDATPHAHTVTQSGEAVFSKLSHAVAELVDNAIEALQIGEEDPLGRPDGVVRVIVRDDPQHGAFMIVVDNGPGMSHLELRDFARYAYNKEARGIARRNTDGRVGSDISRYGVGAKASGLYIGDRMLVLTHEANVDTVSELVIDARRMEEAAAAKKWSDQFELPFRKRQLGALFNSNDPEALCPAVQELVQGEKRAESFTAVVLRLKHQHRERLAADEGAELAKDLAHIEHMFLHPLLRDQVTGRGVTRSGATRAGEDTRRQLTIKYEYQNAGSVRRVDLKDLDDNIGALVWSKAAENRQTFIIEVKNPRYLEDPGAAKAQNLPQRLKVHGVLLYYPFHGTSESRPQHHGKQPLSAFVESEARPASAGPEVITIDDDDEDEVVTHPRLREDKKRSRVFGLAAGSGSTAPKPLFEVFWGGRLLPKCGVAFLEDILPRDIPSARKNFGDAWLQRIGGALFLDHGFDPQNNKLDVNLRGFSGSLDDYLSAKRNPRGEVQYDPRTRDLKANVKAWLTDCHMQLDKDCMFSERLEYAPDDNLDFTYFNKISFGFCMDSPQFKVGDRVRLKVKQGSKGTIYGMITAFIIQERLEDGVTQAAAGGGLVELELQPIELYGDDNIFYGKTNMLANKASDGKLTAKVSEEEWKEGVEELQHLLPDNVQPMQKLNDTWRPLFKADSRTLCLKSNDDYFRDVVVYVEDKKNDRITKVSTRHPEHKSARKLQVWARITDLNLPEDDPEHIKRSVVVTEEMTTGGRDGFKIPDIGRLMGAGRYKVEFLTGFVQRKKIPLVQLEENGFLAKSGPQEVLVAAKPNKLMLTWTPSSLEVFNGERLPTLELEPLDDKNKPCPVKDATVTLTVSDEHTYLTRESKFVRKVTTTSAIPCAQINGYRVTKEGDPENPEPLKMPVVLDVSLEVPPDSPEEVPLELSNRIQFTLRGGPAAKLLLADVEYGEDKGFPAGAEESKTGERPIQAEDGEELPKLHLTVQDKFGHITAPPDGKVWGLVVAKTDENPGVVARHTEGGDVLIVRDGMPCLDALKCDLSKADKAGLEVGPDGLGIPLLLQLHEVEITANKRKKPNIATGALLASTVLQANVSHSSRPTRLCLRHEGALWEPGTVGAKEIAAGLALELTLALFDGAGRELAYSPAMLGTGAVRVEVEDYQDRGSIRMDSKKLPQLLPVKLATRHAGETVTFRVTAELKGEAREFDEEFHVALKAGPAMAWYIAPPDFDVNAFTPYYAATTQAAAREVDDDVANAPREVRPCDPVSLWEAFPAFWAVDEFGNKAELPANIINTPINGENGCPIMIITGTDGANSVMWGIKGPTKAVASQEPKIEWYSMDEYPIELFAREAGRVAGNFWQLPSRDSTSPGCMVDAKKQCYEVKILGAGLQPATARLHILGGTPHRLVIKGDALGLDDWAHLLPEKVSLLPHTVLRGLQLALVDRRNEIAEFEDLGKYFRVAIVCEEETKYASIKGDSLEMNVPALRLVEEGDIEFSLRRTNRAGRGVAPLDQDVDLLRIPYCITHLNKVVSVRLELQDDPDGDNELTLPLSRAGFPHLAARFTLDSDQAFVPNASAVELSLWIDRSKKKKTKKGKSSRMEALASSATHHQAQSVDGAIIFHGKAPDSEPATSSQVLIPDPGIYEYRVVYKEYRTEILQHLEEGEKQMESEPFTMNVIPGFPERIALTTDTAAPGALTAKCHPQASDRQAMLIQNFSLKAVDFAGNVVPAQEGDTAKVEVERADDGGDATSGDTRPVRQQEAGDVQLADLHGRPTAEVEAGRGRRKCFVFDSVRLHKSQGYHAGKYNLVFTFLMQRVREAGSQPEPFTLRYRLPFTAVTHDARAEQYDKMIAGQNKIRSKIERVTDHIRRLEKPIEESKREVDLFLRNGMNVEDRSWVLASTPRGTELTIDVVTPVVITALTTENDQAGAEMELQMLNSQPRPARMRDDLSIPQGYNPLGRLVELAYVEDVRHAEIISWIITQTWMSAVVFRDGKECRTFNAAQMRKRTRKDTSIALTMVKKFRFRERSGALRDRTPEEKDACELPLPLVRAVGFVGYAVNMIKLRPDQEYLRDELFFSQIGKAMIFQKLDDCIRYREANPGTAPPLFGLDGTCVRTRGGLNPNDTMPRNLDFVFGAPPIDFSSNPQLIRVQRRRQLLKDLGQLVTAYSSAVNAAEQPSTYAPFDGAQADSKPSPPESNSPDGTEESKGEEAEQVPPLSQLRKTLADLLQQQRDADAKLNTFTHDGGGASAGGSMRAPMRRRRDFEEFSSQTHVPPSPLARRRCRR